MWKGCFAVLACIVIVSAGCPGCAVRERAGGADSVSSQEKLLTPEEMTGAAQERYDLVLRMGLGEEDALNDAVTFLRKQKNVAVVKMYGRNSLRVVLTGGGSVIIPLGQDRM